MDDTNERNSGTMLSLENDDASACSMVVARMIHFSGGEIKPDCSLLTTSIGLS